MWTFWTDALRAFEWFVLAYFVTLNSIYLLLIWLAASEARRGRQRPTTTAHGDIFANPLTPPVSVVMSARNEEQSIVDSVRGALELRYPLHEVVVVDDGSTDSTFELLRMEFDLVECAPALADDVVTLGAVRSMHVPTGPEPLVVVRKVNTGTRADGLNVGLNAARYPLVCCVDADSILERDALLRVSRPFVDDPDRVVATGGSIRAVNGSAVYRGQLTSIHQPRSWLARIQIVEYLRSFLLGRTGWSRLGGLLIISGAFGLFRRDLLVAIGGYDHKSLGEDADVIARMHRELRDRGDDYRIEFVPDPVCWTEVPTSLKDLSRQRQRWSHGLAQVLWKQRAMIGRPKYGRIGVVVLPYYLIFELLGPIVELVGLVALVAGLALGAVSVEFAVLFASVAVLYGVLLSMSSLLVQEVAYRRYSAWTDLFSSILAAILENVGFRQLHAWWRVRGLYSALRRQEVGWGELSRAGFDAESVP